VNYILLLLTLFVILALYHDRLGRITYVIMGFAIFAYVFYTYGHPPR